MGSNCCPKAQTERDTIVNDNGTITKKCTDQELKFWDELVKLKLVKISNISRKTIEFNYSDLFMENYISLTQIMEYLVIDQNFLYFFPIFEMVLGIIDFLQIIFHLKKKYELNNFFLLKFEKFFLQKCNGSQYYSKLVYLDSKLNDNFSLSEIIMKEDQNLLSSFSVMEVGNSMQALLSTLNSTNMHNMPVGKSSYQLDINTYFFSKCNERYQSLKNNYSLEECEKFYAENILNFLSKFLFKKTSMAIQTLEHEFSNLKHIFRHTISYYFKNSENTLNLENLKAILTNFYLNNFEYNSLKENFNKILSGATQDKLLLDKILSFQKADILVNHGDCDIIKTTGIEDEEDHSIAFIYDKVINNIDYSVCLNCFKNIIIKKVPDSRSDMITYAQFEAEVVKRNSFINLRSNLKYFCSSFIDNNFLQSRVNDIYLYKRNKHCVSFEYIEWDEYREEVLKDEILNLDFIAKNNINKGKKKNENSLLIAPKN